VRENGSWNESAPWRTVGELVEVDNATRRYSYALDAVDAYTAYEFRVVPYWLDFGKSMPGLPSNSSAPITPALLYLGMSPSHMHGHSTAACSFLVTSS